MKTVYFVRHGQSVGNVGPIRQGPLGPLNEKGKEQATVIANRCAKLPIEIIISSTMTRTKETTDLILEKLSKPVQYSDLFVERRRPSEQIETPKDSPRSLEIDAIVKANFIKPGFRFSDEENLEDLRTRAETALTYLEQCPEEKILVVTHGFFMRILTARMILGKNFTAEECEQFIRSLHMENTGLTIFGYDETYPEHPWYLWVWNDHAHLG